MRKLICGLLILPAVSLAGNIRIIPWGMFQQNASHTGYIDTKLNLKHATFDWKVFVGDNPNGVRFDLSQPVVAGNMVYVSRSNYAYSNTLQALSIKDGHEIWRKDYKNVMINPPSVVNGYVYIQTVNNSSPDTALYCYKASDGKIIFKSPTSAQWEHYLSPTVFDNHVYVDGGSYGGMYSFDSKTGDKNWFAGLAQYDGWTPAVNAQYAIAYTGGHLNVLDRMTGKVAADIADPNYQWSGYDSGFAPVILNVNDVLGIQSGYLTLFDLPNRNTKWSAGPGYIGQPVYDGKFIYASKNGGLMAVDRTGKLVWSWYQDNENVLGQMLVTENLVFVSTDKKVYAISKKSHEPVWSYEASGTLSIGMGHLYILDRDGNLSSISVE